MASTRYVVSLVTGFRTPSGGSHTRAGMMRPNEVSILDTDNSHLPVRVYVSGSAYKGEYGGVSPEKTLQIAEAECERLNKEEGRWERLHGVFRHGKGGYANHRCRCHVCTEANRASVAAYRVLHGRPRNTW